MKTFVGTIIVIISVSIIAFELWYYHFYMVAFGRGLPEASYYLRVIASALTSIPFIAFIYLALYYLIFGSKDEKETPVRGKWSLSQITAAFVCFSFFWAIIPGVIIGIYLSVTQKEAEMACRKMVSDAHYTMAAVADYYADPGHLSLPTADQLMEVGYFSTDFAVTIEEDSNGDPVIIVIDDNAECPKGKKYVHYNYGIESGWKD